VVKISVECDLNFGTVVEETDRPCSRNGWSRVSRVAVASTRKVQSAELSPDDNSRYEAIILIKFHSSVHLI
jgi:hypothetical protein